MQQTSETWKRLYIGLILGGSSLEARAVIGGEIYEDITPPVISRALMQGGIAVGSAAAANCRFSLRGDAVPAKSARVQVQMRLVSEAEASEWLPAGTYFISRRSRDRVTGRLSLECYDALLKANALWTPSSGSWPRSMAAVAQELAGTLGLELDGRTSLRTGSLYTVDAPGAGTTLRDVLQAIGAAHGGGWIVTPANKLRLVPLISAAGAEEAEEDAIDVAGVLGGIRSGAAASVTGVRCTVEDSTWMTGDESGVVLDVSMTPALAAELAERVIGIACQPFDMEGAVYDPAAELGDYVRRGDLSGVLYCETVSLGPLPRGSLSSPDPAELADEYPYIGAAAKALTLAKAYAREAAEAVDAGLTQREVFNRLTNNGAAQGLILSDGSLYVNAAYINTGELSADRIRGGTLILGGLNNANGILRVLDADGAEVGTWNSDGISLEKGTVGIAVDEDTLGLNTPVYYSAANPVYYPFLVSYHPANDNNRVYATIRNGVLAMELGRIGGGSRVLSGSTTVTPNRIVVGMSGFARTEISNGAFSVYKSRTTRWLYTGTNLSGEEVLNIAGALNVTGTKSRVASADQYGSRLLYCYETPSPMFGDVGEGVIGEDGLCYVWLDPVFARTVSNAPYQVFLQPYGAGECFVAERRGGCFVVRGEPGLSFGWELKARQAGYDQRRLERAEGMGQSERTDYGGEAVLHIMDLKEIPHNVCSGLTDEFHPSSA